MGTQGFYRGTSHDQVPFFADKEKKMIESRSWPPEYDADVDMSKVNLDVLSSWITKRITELLGFEDDIVIDYCRQQLNPPVIEGSTTEKVCPKKLQINLTGFLAKDAARFVKELWSLLLSAQESQNGIPDKLLQYNRDELGLKEQQSKIIGEALNKLNQSKSHRDSSSSISKSSSEHPKSRAASSSRSAVARTARKTHRSQSSNSNERSVSSSSERELSRRNHYHSRSPKRRVLSSRSPRGYRRDYHRSRQRQYSPRQYPRQRQTGYRSGRYRSHERKYERYDMSPRRPNISRSYRYRYNPHDSSHAFDKQRDIASPHYRRQISPPPSYRRRAPRSGPDKQRFSPPLGLEARSMSQDHSSDHLSARLKSKGSYSGSSRSKTRESEKKTIRKQSLSSTNSFLSDKSMSERTAKLKKAMRSLSRCSQESYDEALATMHPYKKKKASPSKMDIFDSKVINLPAAKHDTSPSVNLAISTLIQHSGPQTIDSLTGETSNETVKERYRSREPYKHASEKHLTPSREKSFTRTMHRSPSIDSFSSAQRNAGETPLRMCCSCKRDALVGYSGLKRSRMSSQGNDKNLRTRESLHESSKEPSYSRGCDHAVESHAGKSEQNEASRVSKLPPEPEHSDDRNSAMLPRKDQDKGTSASPIDAEVTSKSDNKSQGNLKMKSDTGDRYAGRCYMDQIDQGHNRLYKVPAPVAQIKYQ